MTTPITRFDAARAQRFRKRTLVLAFRCGAPFTFHKSWGEQRLPAGAWVAVPLDHEERPTPDLYGIDEAVFARTYEAVAPDRPSTWRKTGTVEAYQPGEAFTVETVVHGRTETERAEGSATAWLVRGEAGEFWPVEDETFRRTHEEASEVP